MSSPSEKIDYLLLFRGTNWGDGLSPEQVQQVVADWYAWFERLKAEGRCSGGRPLENKGKIVSGRRAVRSRRPAPAGFRARRV